MSRSTGLPQASISLPWNATCATAQLLFRRVWTPRTWEGLRGLYNWGPPPPPSFLAPEDLAGLMTGDRGRTRNSRQRHRQPA